MSNGNILRGPLSNESEVTNQLRPQSSDNTSPINKHLIDVMMHTTQEWQDREGYVPTEDSMAIYTDYRVTSGGIDIPGIKIGDGVTPIEDLPFITDWEDEKIGELQAWFRNIFLGETTTEIYDGCTNNTIIVDGETITAENGNIAAYGQKEFIWDGHNIKWVEFGVAVTENTVSGWGFTKNLGTVTSVSAGTGLSISGTASTTPTVNVASGYKLPTTTEWGNKADLPIALIVNEGNALDFDEVLATIQSGEKIVLANSPAGYCYVATLSSSQITFQSLPNPGYTEAIRKITYKKSGGWQNPEYVQFENTTNKVTSISSGSTNAQYPSAKAVYDAIPTKTSDLTNDSGYTTNVGTVTSVAAGTGLSISGTPSVTPTVNVASGYKLPTTTEWNNATTFEKGTGASSAQQAGTGAVASGNYSVAEGQGTSASGNSSHSEGFNTSATASYSHAEGYVNTASGAASHAEGSNSRASGASAHAEGEQARATGQHSHAEGNQCTAVGAKSHAEGNYTTANNIAEHAQGQYNISNTVAESSFGNAGNTIHSIGIGPSSTDKKNAVEVMQNGDTYINGVGTYVGTNPISGTNDVATIINSKVEGTFIAMEGGTSFADIKAAIDAGRGVLCMGPAGYAYLTENASNYITFESLQSSSYNGASRKVTVNDSNTWTTSYVGFDLVYDTSNKKLKKNYGSSTYVDVVTAAKIVEDGVATANLISQSDFNAIFN